MELTNVKYLERGLRMSGDKPNADLVRDMADELAAIRADNERLREALNEIVSATSAGGWVPSLQHCVDVAKEALK